MLSSLSLTSLYITFQRVSPTTVLQYCAATWGYMGFIGLSRRFFAPKLQKISVRRHNVCKSLHKAATLHKLGGTHPARATHPARGTHPARAAHLPHHEPRLAAAVSHADFEAGVHPLNKLGHVGYHAHKTAPFSLQLYKGVDS